MAFFVVFYIYFFVEDCINHIFSSFFECFTMKFGQIFIGKQECFLIITISISVNLIDVLFFLDGRPQTLLLSLNVFL